MTIFTEFEKVKLEVKVGILRGVVGCIQASGEDGDVNPNTSYTAVHQVCQC